MIRLKRQHCCTTTTIQDGLSLDPREISCPSSTMSSFFIQKISDWSWKRWLLSKTRFQFFKKVERNFCLFVDVSLFTNKLHESVISSEYTNQNYALVWHFYTIFDFLHVNKSYNSNTMSQFMLNLLRHYFSPIKTKNISLLSSITLFIRFQWKPDSLNIKNSFRIDYIVVVTIGRNTGRIAVQHTW